MSLSSTTSKRSNSNRVPPISTKVERTLDPCVVLMKELIGQYADLWKDKGGIFSLAQGVVYWTPPEESKLALQEAIDDRSSMLHMYGPDEGLPELRVKLQEKLRQENGLEDQHVIVTTGANQAYMNCVLTLLQETDKSVVFQPYYFNHVMALQMCLTDAESRMLVGPSSDQGIPDLDWLEEQLRQDEDIRMVTLVNPGNPTGKLQSRETLQRAVDLCRQYNTWLILDCTYEYFVPDSLFDGCFSEPHVLHIFSFSKAYALAGYRCGYVAISQHAENVYEQMMKVQDTIPICPPRIGQIAALGALQAGRDWVQKQVATLDAGRQAILQALGTLEKRMGGSGAIYVMGKLPVHQQDDVLVATKLVHDYGVAIIPGSFCGFPGWIRVCYANLPPEKCLEAAERLRQGILALDE